MTTPNPFSTGAMFDWAAGKMAEGQPRAWLALQPIDISRLAAVLESKIDKHQRILDAMFEIIYEDVIESINLVDTLVDLDREP